MGRRQYSFSYSSREYNAYPAYVSVAEKRARNLAAVKKLGRQNADLRPVQVEGRTIATSWWGKSWNQNLERYADYENRIGRGRSYLCHGAVLDLQIEPGRVAALVQGSRPKPYEVTVSIGKLPSATWEKLRQEALSCLNSLPELLAGKFPQALKDVFFAEGTGLFPNPREITFKCSCPDWAHVCKHVAAVLYGVGNRLDQSPELLFVLRQVTVDELISEAVQASSQSMLERAGQAAGDDLLADADLEDVFGIELGGIESSTGSGPTAAVAAAAATPKPAVPKRGAPKAKAAPATPVPVKLDLVQKGCAKRNPIVGRLSQPPECASIRPKTGQIRRTVAPPPGLAAEPTPHRRHRMPPHSKAKPFLDGVKLGAEAKGKRPAEVAGTARAKRPAVAWPVATPAPAALRRAAASAKSAPAVPAAPGAAKLGVSGKIQPPAKAKPGHGEMIDLLLAVVPVGKPFVTGDLVAWLPEWSKMQVASTLNRAVGKGLVERVRHGVFRRRKSG